MVSVFRGLSSNCSGGPQPVISVVNCVEPPTDSVSRVIAVVLSGATICCYLLASGIQPFNDFVGDFLPLRICSVFDPKLSYDSQQSRRQNVPLWFCLGSLRCILMKKTSFFSHKLRVTANVQIEIVRECTHIHSRTTIKIVSKTIIECC